MEASLFQAVPCAVIVPRRNIPTRTLKDIHRHPNPYNETYSTLKLKYRYYDILSYFPIINKDGHILDVYLFTNIQLMLDCVYLLLLTRTTQIQYKTFFLLFELLHV